MAFRPQLPLDNDQDAALGYLNPDLSPLLRSGELRWGAKLLEH
jgi:hypothetical protein